MSEAAYAVPEVGILIRNPSPLSSFEALIHIEMSNVVQVVDIVHICFLLQMVLLFQIADDR